jgi:hypothetical protein
MVFAFCLAAWAFGVAAGSQAGEVDSLAELHHELAVKRLEVMQPILSSYKQKLDNLTNQFLQAGNAEKVRDAQEEIALIEAELARLIKTAEQTKVPVAPVQVVAPSPSPEPVAVNRTPLTHVSSIRGLAGAAAFSENNVYKFTLPDTGTISTLTFYATGRRSIDTVGNVWLINPAGEREKVMKWKSSYFKTPASEVKNYKDLKPISEDISKHVKGPGTYQVEFEWTGGIDPLVIYQVGITS